MQEISSKLSHTEEAPKAWLLKERQIFNDAKVYPAILASECEFFNSLKSYFSFVGSSILS